MYVQLHVIRDTILQIKKNNVQMLINVNKSKIKFINNQYKINKYVKNNVFMNKNN